MNRFQILPHFCPDWLRVRAGERIDATQAPQLTVQKAIRWAGEDTLLGDVIMYAEFRTRKLKRLRMARKIVQGRRRARDFAISLWLQ